MLQEDNVRPCVDWAIYPFFSRSPAGKQKHRFVAVHLFRIPSFYISRPAAITCLTSVCTYPISVLYQPRKKYMFLYKNLFLNQHTNFFYFNAIPYC